MKNQDNKICFVSVDIEGDLMHGNDKTFESLNNVSDILVLFKKYNVPATLFVSGIIIEKFPEIVKEWAKDFEIGSHNYVHESVSNLNVETRKNDIAKFNHFYQSLLQKSCQGFRAPRHIIDSTQINILETNGYSYDSSVIPYYVPFKKYTGYKGRAPFMPYKIDTNNPLKSGDGKIVELPLTPLIFGIPFSGTWLRYFGSSFFKLLMVFKKPQYLSLMMHSWDAMKFSGKNAKNTGEPFLIILDEMLEYLVKSGYEFKNGNDIALNYGK